MICGKLKQSFRESVILMIKSWFLNKQRKSNLFCFLLIWYQIMFLTRFFMLQSPKHPHISFCFYFVLCPIKRIKVQVERKMAVNLPSAIIDSFVKFLLLFLACVLFFSPQRSLFWKQSRRHELKLIVRENLSWKM